MKLTNSIKILIPALLCLALSACGFHLRGTADLPPELQTLQVVSVDEGSELLREIVTALRTNGVDIAEESHPVRLGIGREETTERTLSVNANARAGEYEIEMSVLFQLAANGEVVLGPELVQLTRSYLADPENAVAKQEEAELIREEMRREIAQQILRRLQTVEI